MTKALFVGFATLDIFDNQTCLGGAAASMSINASKLGIESYLLAPLANDQLSQKYLQQIDSAGVNTSLSTNTASSLPTLKLKDPKNQTAQTEFSDNGAVDAIEDIEISLTDIDQFDVIFCANAHPRLLEKLVPKLTAQNLFYIPGPQVTVQSDYIVSDLYPFCLGVFANPIETPYVVLTKPLDSGAQLFIQTLGKNGGKITSARGEKYSYSAIKVENVTDTTGAGDAFALGFGISYIEFRDVNQAIETGKQKAMEIIKIIQN